MKLCAFLFERFGRAIVAWAVLGWLVIGGCVSEQDRELVVYVALDREFSEPILKDFEKETGIHVRAKYDVESNKTVGLANELLAAGSRGRADVFWNNEILHTLRLEQAGRLASYHSPREPEFPPAFYSADGNWHGFAARARVIIVNTDLLSEVEQRPTSIEALADPKWKGACGMARPLFGTTATHAAVLFDVWGDARAEAFFEAVAGNAVIEGGNKQVARNVAMGRYAWGVTDTDDAVIELDDGQPVAIIFPDQAPEGMGALLIPNTLAILAEAAHTDDARALVDYLLNAKVEERLTRGSSAQIPLSKAAQGVSRVVPQSLHILEADFVRAAQGWEEVSNRLLRIFP
jgi:iron(III) transport system substrate-binding protein